MACGLTGVARAQGDAVVTLPGATPHAPPPALSLPRNTVTALQRAGMDVKALYLSVRAVTPEPAATASAASAAGAPAAAIANAPIVLDAQGSHSAVLASTAKVITALASLDVLGVKHRWQTRAYLSGPLKDGVLDGSLYLVGGGDALLTSAQLTAWFKRLREQRGLREIRGAIVLDRHGFALKKEDHAGTPEPTAENPHHAWPDALRVDGGQVSATLTAGPRGSLLTQWEPPFEWNDELRRRSVRCDALREPARIEPVPTAANAASAPATVSSFVLRGEWSPACDKLRLETAIVAPGALATAAVRMAWLAASGSVDTGTTVTLAEQPPAWWQPLRKRQRPLRPWAVLDGAPLPTVLREMNKWSDNLVARHLMLSLAPEFPRRPATLDSARKRFVQWLQGQGFGADELTLDNGSGLSLAERGKPHALTQLLASAWQRGSANQPFLDSLPVAGEDGTLSDRLQRLPTGARAWLKTGSLSQTRGLAGYVQAKSGRVYAVAALLNHPNAPRGEFALDTLIQHIAERG
jgi:serine-type D-Ala-D-Ala carboxypeptidase/endopeptidase (penicillin-binding protein 4)